MQDILSTYASEESKSEAKRINQALEFQWKKAAIGLFEGHQILFFVTLQLPIICLVILIPS